MAQDATDAKTSYGYLFKANKSPTEVLDALLRGIAVYIVSSLVFRTTRAQSAPSSRLTIPSQSENIGRKDEKHLVPEKLAAFYKAVGGNYDCASYFPRLDIHHPMAEIS